MKCFACSGASGMGKVYQVRHIISDRIEEIKVLCCPT
jgi:hypothetical protein